MAGVVTSGIVVGVAAGSCVSRRRGTLIAGATSAEHHDVEIALDVSRAKGGGPNSCCFAT